MSAHQEPLGRSSGHGARPAEWLNTHLGGLIMPFGERVEAALDRSMFLIVNNFFLRLGKIYLVVLAPLIFIEFVMKFTGL